jgi:hypothetical protein
MVYNSDILQYNCQQQQVTAPDRAVDRGPLRNGQRHNRSRRPGGEMKAVARDHLRCGKDHEPLHCLAAVDERSGQLRCAESASAHGTDLFEQAILVPVDPMLRDLSVEDPVDVNFRPRHARVRWLLPHQ